MELRSEIVIHRPAAVVWEILGTRFGEVGRFASSIQASSLEGHPCVGASRACEVGSMPGAAGKTVTERLFEFDPDAMSLGYELARGAPRMLRRATNRWSVHALGPDRSRVTAHATADIALWMLPLYPLLRLGLNLMGRRFLEELKHFAELGVPHPRKLAAVRREGRAEVAR